MFARLLCPPFGLPPFGLRLPRWGTSGEFLAAEARPLSTQDEAHKALEVSSKTSLAKFKQIYAHDDADTRPAIRNGVFPNNFAIVGMALVILGGTSISEFYSVPR